MIGKGILSEKFTEGVRYLDEGKSLENCWELIDNDSLSEDQKEILLISLQKREKRNELRRKRFSNTGIIKYSSTLLTMTGVGICWDVLYNNQSLTSELGGSALVLGGLFSLIGFLIKLILRFVKNPK